eukprot:g40547.t1
MCEESAKNHRPAGRADEGDHSKQAHYYKSFHLHSTSINFGNDFNHYSEFKSTPSSVASLHNRSIKRCCSRVRNARNPSIVALVTSPS